MARAKGITNTVEVKLSEFAKLSNFATLSVPVSRRWIGEVRSLLGVSLEATESAPAETEAAEATASESRPSFTE